MTAPITKQDFLESLQASQLLKPELLEKISTQVKERANDFPDIRQLARSLVKSGYITPYQATQLLAGRYKGFYIGKYKLMELLGAGGMGKVYLAEQITMERIVVIKVIRRPSRAKEELLARFKREAKAVASLAHPNIIQAFDFDEENGIPYMVMEYVEGIDSSEQIASFGPVSYQQAADYVCQAAAGLQHAHQNKLVHRDIKPANLLIGTDGTLKLLDLGLVSTLNEQRDDSLTSSENQLGTVDYIAPEQALDSHNVDGRADLYSLGATFYFLISGKILFPGKQTAQKLILHQMQEPQPIEELVPDLPPELAAVIKKMLAKKREDRYQDAGEVIAAVKPFATAVKPPFDPSAIKFKRDSYTPYLSRSPHPNDISINELSTSDSSPTLAKASPSMISVDTPEPPEDDFLGSLSGDMPFDLASSTMVGGTTTRMPRRTGSLSSSRSGTKRKRKKKNKGKFSNLDWKIWAGGGAALTVLLVTLLMMWTLRSRDETIAEDGNAPGAIATNQTEDASRLPGGNADNKENYQVNVPGGAVMYLRFDTSKGKKLTDQISGKDSITLAHDIVSVPGLYGDAIHLNGKNEFIPLPTVSINPEQCTISLWFKTNNLKKDATLLGSDPAQPYLIQLKGGKLHTTIGETKARIVAAKAPLKPKQWHHVAASWKKDELIRLYIDGKLQGTTNTARLSATKNVALGAMNQKAGFFEGEFDEFRIYNKPLSESEIQTLAINPNAK